MGSPASQRPAQGQLEAAMAATAGVDRSMASMAGGTRGGAPRSGLQISAGIQIDLTHSGFGGQPPQMPTAVIASALTPARIAEIASLGPQ